MTNGLFALQLQQKKTMIPLLILFDLLPSKEFDMRPWQNCVNLIFCDGAIVVWWCLMASPNNGAVYTISNPLAAWHKSRNKECHRQSNLWCLFNFMSNHNGHKRPMKIFTIGFRLCVIYTFLRQSTCCLYKNNGSRNLLFRMFKNNSCPKCNF